MQIQAQGTSSFFLERYSRAKEYAEEQITLYLKMLLGNTKARLAWVGKGDGTVIVEDDENFIYARLDSETGTLIEARLVNLLTPAEDDFVFVKREKPGGLGGWLVLDWFGENAPIRTCEVSIVFESGFYVIIADEVNYDDIKLVYVSELAAGGGSSEIVFTINNFEFFNTFLMRSVTAPSILTPIVGGFFVESSDNGAHSVINYSIRKSYDGGHSFTEKCFIVGGAPYEENSAFISDPINPNLIWVAYGYPQGFGTPPYYTDGGIAVTTDAGETFETIIARTAPSGSAVLSGAIIPRMDGHSAYHICHYTANFPGSAQHVFISIWDTDGGLQETGNYEIDPAAFGGDGVNGESIIRFGAVRSADINVLYVTNNSYKLFSYDWNSGVGTLLHLPNAGFTGFNVDIKVTKEDTLLYVLRDPSNSILFVNRSVDGGITWTDMDLSYPIRPLTGFTDSWDPICIDGFNNIFIPFNTGEGLFSNDDGVTWIVTGDFMLHGTVWNAAGITGIGGS